MIVRKEKMIKDQERDKEKSTLCDKVKDKMYHYVNEDHKELFIGANNIGSKHPEVHLEGHAFLPYKVIYIEGKNHFGDKLNNKVDKDCGAKEHNSSQEED